MDTATKELTGDRIEWVKFSGAVWAPDSKGFYYSAYDAPKTGTYSSQNQFQKVFYHALGTPQSADRLIYEDKAHPLRYFSAWPSQDGRWLFLVGSEGTSGSEILVRKVSERKLPDAAPGLRLRLPPHRLPGRQSLLHDQRGGLELCPEADLADEARTGRHGDPRASEKPARRGGQGRPATSSPPTCRMHRTASRSMTTTESWSVRSSSRPSVP